jgi:membrane protein involved in colicin uptake
MWLTQWAATAEAAAAAEAATHRQWRRRAPDVGGSGSIGSGAPTIGRPSRWRQARGLLDVNVATPSTTE